MNRIEFFRARPAADKGTRYSWEPSPALAKAGWPTVPLGFNAKDAQAKAEEINHLVAQWRAGELDRVPPVIANLKKSKTPSIYHRRRLARPAPLQGTVGWLITQYLASEEYAGLAENTRRVYRPNLDLVREWCGDLPIDAVRPKQIKDLYRQLRARAPHRANAVLIMGRTLYKWGISEDLTEHNPWLSVEAKAAKRELPELWSPAAVDWFVQTADALDLPSIGTAVLLNEWLGQRQADVLAWDWSLYKGGRLTLTQRKTGARVALPVAMVGRLSERLEAERKRQEGRGVRSTKIIVDENTGGAYNESTFRHLFSEVRAAADAAAEDGGFAELTFMRLRHTAVTRLAEAGCTPQQIAAITGHSLKSIMMILERYLVLTTKLAEGAFALRLKAEAATTSTDE